MIAYASRTGTKRNLAALRAAGWRLMLSPTGELRDEGFAYALDNGAWTAYNSKTAWDEAAFVDALARFGARADFVAAPDVVGGGLDSLRLSTSWLARCLGSRCGRVLIPVQDGMQPDDVASLLCRQVGIFVGGTDKWKEQSTPIWAELADVRRAYIHVGRVNSQRRLRICQTSGVNSFDGSGPSRFEKHLQQMERGLAQPCFRVAEPTRMKRTRQPPGPKPEVMLCHTMTGEVAPLVEWAKRLAVQLGVPYRVADKRLRDAAKFNRTYLRLRRSEVRHVA